MTSRRSKGNGESRPAICVVAFNDLEHASRVRTIISTLARHGSDVTALGMTRESAGWQRALDGMEIRVLALPVIGRRRAVVLGKMADAADAALRRLVERRRIRVDAAKARVAERRAVVKRTARGPERRRAAAALERARRELERARPGRAERWAASLLRALRRRLGVRAAEIRRSPRLKYRSWARVRRRLVWQVVRRRPNAVCAHGADGLLVATSARRWLRVLGKRPVVIYDALEWTVGRASWFSDRPGLPNEVEFERNLIHAADVVITVSEPLARTLQQHHQLESKPSVVQNAPAAKHSMIPAPDLAALAKLPDGARILIYVGMIRERRGVGDAISALPLLPDDLHLVLLGMAPEWHAEDLVNKASALGVGDRLRIAGPVAPEMVVPTIRRAEIGLVPFHHYDQHHLTMPNKLFQYAQAGLPIVSSDCEQPSRFVRDLDIGEVFSAEDPNSLAAAVIRALDRRDEIRSRLESPQLRWAISWESQEGRLLEVFRRVGALPEIGDTAVPAFEALHSRGGDAGSEEAHLRETREPT